MLALRRQWPRTVETYCRLRQSRQFFGTDGPEQQRQKKADPGPLNICGQHYDRDDWTNVTGKIVSLTERQLYRTSGNPIKLIADGIKEHFSDFRAFEYPSPVVDLQANFDSLLIAADHVSRSKTDTYYVNKDLILRSHTSAHQAHCLQQGAQSFICIADVYRRDAIDATHFPAFHQCEVMQLLDRQQLNMDVLRTSAVDRNPQTQEWHTEPAAREAERLLKSYTERYVRKLLGKNLQMRWIDAYFPFTHPSFELEILFNGEWLEILGCGVVEHKLLQNSNVHDKIAWALGFGLERLAMLKYSIPDIRLFWSKDSGFLSQFDGAEPWTSITYRPISTYPQCVNDISFWLPREAHDSFSPNDFYDLVRSVGGDLVEQVTLKDDFVNKKIGKRSHCYRIVYRSCDRTLTQAEVNQVHALIEQTASQELDVEIR